MKDSYEILVGLICMAAVPLLLSIAVLTTVSDDNIREYAEYVVAHYVDLYQYVKAVGNK